MTYLDYVQRARRDFVEAGPEGHYQCPAEQVSGFSEGRFCVSYRALLTESDTRKGWVFWLKRTWPLVAPDGERMEATSSRGFDACVEVYDQIILNLTQATPSTPEAIPA